MEQFIVSARKYRPTQFNEVVGQRAITDTLENAIANNHLAQALLFTGPRGVGKTTCARILAKRINESSNQQTDEDFAFNIFELDAASNNSVDDIRELIDQVRIPPQVGKYKVYIIDEVHMLSTAAFNAFLKTLEEPPQHAIFILATTEKHKIIPTILSRCQIFDFKRIGVIDIKNHLQEIADKEGIVADEDALHIIAQKADGALRDALSAFDRVVGFSGKHLTREAVAENLNILDYSYYFEMSYLLLKNDIPNVFLAYDQILNKGYDGHQFIRGLASHFRDLLIGQNQATISLLEVGDTIKEMYLKQSKMASSSFLKKAIGLANTCDLNYKNSQNQRLLVELCLLELASLNSTEETKIEIERVIIPPKKVERSTDTPNFQSSKKEVAQEPVATEILKPTPPTPISVSTQMVETVLETEEKPQEDKIKIEETENNTSIIENTLEEIKLPKKAEEKEPKANEEIDKHTLESTNTPDALKIPEEKQGEKPLKRRVSVLSLNSIQQKKEIKRGLEAHKTDTLIRPTETFTSKDFQKAWKEYSDIVSGKKMHNLASHLTMAMPTINGNIASVEYPNNTIKIEVERNRGDLLSFIREKLQNYDFDLEITVNETITENYVYTDREIYDKMAEINPNIHVFRQELDLDI